MAQYEYVSEAFWNKLQYLLYVGYNQDVIDACKQFCLDQEYDEEGIIDDFDDIGDTSITENLQEMYHWDDRKKNDFFLRVRQALDIDVKTYTNQYISQANNESVEQCFERIKTQLSEFHEKTAKLDILNQKYQKIYARLKEEHKRLKKQRFQHLQGMHKQIYRSMMFSYT